MDIEPLDPNYVETVLSNKPFVSINGVYNVRDLGGYPTSEPGLITRSGYIYRSAELSSITDEGKVQMKASNISKVFDLRSTTEISKWDAPIPSIEDVEIQWTPVFKTEDYSPEMMARRFRLYASGKTEAFLELYYQILNNGGPVLETILRHIRDEPYRGFLFHCTAGKDRTGVIAAILLKLVGVSDSDIAEDYALTRVGREPCRQMVMARLAKEPIFAANTEAALNMFSCRRETMLAFLSDFTEKHGNIDEYLKRHTSVTDNDLAIIRRNLTESDS